MTGCNVKGDPATILDHNRTSLVGMVIPDPAVMTSSSLKFKSLEQDRMNISRRMFQQSGLVSMSPRNEPVNAEIMGTPNRYTRSRGKSDLI